MKIICVGRNYIDHAKELNNPVPKEPVLFMKPSTALLINQRPFYYPDFSQNIHHEIELVIQISKHGKAIDPKFAHKYYDKVGLGIDFTARDIQDKCKEKGLPWEIAKAFDYSAVLGNMISIDQLRDKENIAFELKKNQQTVQSGFSKDMIFNFDAIISYASRYFKLLKGDLIYTGTPAGVGPVQIGDTLEGYLEGQSILYVSIK
ncbi:MAG: fumarylacetoacetate hydrolase family protein [Saprospiraceae bacterium]